MKQLRNWLVLTVPIFSTVASASRAQQSQPPGPRVVDLKSTDGTLLKATYFSAGKPGPGVLFFHRANGTRTSRDGVATNSVNASAVIVTNSALDFANRFYRPYHRYPE